MSNDSLKFARRDFLRAGATGALGLIAFPGNVWSHQKVSQLTLYVGTYTSSGSEGIYIYRMNPKSGELTRFSAIKAVNPSFLAIDRSRRFLYAVNEIADFAGKSTGAVSAFAVDSPSGGLTFLNQQPSLGADPCHLTVDRRRKFLLVANYTGGSLSVLPIQPDGSLGAATAFVQHQGSSIKEQQKGPHAHCIIVDRLNRHALAADLGLDRVMVYRFNATTGRLRPGTQPWVSLRPGAGPRHLTLHPNGKYAYVINELDSTVAVFGYDKGVGTLRLIETVSTLPTGFSGTSYCADVHVSPSGKFLYGSNRGHDSIVAFAINESTGRLEHPEHASTQGKWPRNFTIDPSGRFLLVANQRSDNVVTFRIDPGNGRLLDTGHTSEIPSPVCLKFAF